MNPCEIVLMDRLREIQGIRYCKTHNALESECLLEQSRTNIRRLAGGVADVLGAAIFKIVTLTDQRDRAVAEVIALKAERDEARADLARVRQDLAFERTRWAGIGPKKGNGQDADG